MPLFCWHETNCSITAVLGGFDGHFFRQESFSLFSIFSVAMNALTGSVLRSAAVLEVSARTLVRGIASAPCNGTASDVWLSPSSRSFWNADLWLVHRLPRYTTDCFSERRSILRSEEDPMYVLSWILWIWFGTRSTSSAMRLPRWGNTEWLVRSSTSVPKSTFMKLWMKSKRKNYKSMLMRLWKGSDASRDVDVRIDPCYR